jgi:hypothetical protein
MSVTGTSKAYVDAAVAAGGVADATTGSKGKVQLAGDLAGTAAAPTLASTDNVAKILRSTGPNRYFRRTGAIAETYSRRGSQTGNQAALSTGLLQATGIELIAGDVVSKITFQAASTALVTGTNQWFALFSLAGALLGITSDDTSTAWAASAEKQLTLAAAYTVPTTGLYYISCMVAATTVPTLQGVASQSANAAFAPVIAWRDSTHTGLTNPASCPSTATMSASGTYLYGWVS